jgi:ATP-dependent DNA helicase RecQ
MSCSAALLARIAALGAGRGDQLDRLLGDRLAERFGDAFAEVLAEG